MRIKLDTMEKNIVDAHRQKKKLYDARTQTKRIIDALKKTLRMQKKNVIDARDDAKKKHYRCD